MEKEKEAEAEAEKEAEAEEKTATKSVWYENTLRNVLWKLETTQEQTKQCWYEFHIEN